MTNPFSFDESDRNDSDVYKVGTSESGTLCEFDDFNQAVNEINNSGDQTWYVWDEGYEVLACWDGDTQRIETNLAYDLSEFE